MDKRLNVRIGYEVTTIDGDKFCDCTLNYYNMDREKLNVVEHALIFGLLAQLNEAGKAALKK
jgi:hypothetical protein